MDDYTRVNWQNEQQSTRTPLSAENLNNMDEGIFKLFGYVKDILTNKLAPATKTKAGIVKPDGVTTKVLSDGTIVSINGGGGGASVAAQVAFNDSVAELGADNVQDAIDNFKSSYDYQKDKGYLESRNLWDEQVEIGNYSETDGSKVDGSSLRSTNLIKVKPNTQYYFVVPSGQYSRRFYYTSNSLNSYITGSTEVSQGNKIITTPSNCNYIAFQMGFQYGLSYKKDIAIIEGTSGSYQPYAKSNVQLTEDIKDIIKTVQVGFPHIDSLASKTAKTYLNYDVSSSIPSGYKLIGAICEDSGDNEFLCYGCRVEGATTITLKIFNVGSVTDSGSPLVRLFLIRE